MATNNYPFTALTGGGTGALDALDGASLVDGDAAFVVTSTGVYWYHLNATSGATENSPLRISPDTNAGTKRWHLVGTTTIVGCYINNSSTQAVVSGTPTILTWDTEDIDIGSWHSGVNPTRLTIPIGVTDVIFEAYTHHGGLITYGNRHILRILKGGSIITECETNAIAGQSMNINYTGIVTAGDYFEVQARQITGLTQYYVTECYFKVRAIGFA